jgi:hypothetical protein
LVVIVAVVAVFGVAVGRQLPAHSIDAAAQ